MTVKKMAAIWLWFKTQWKPEVNLPRPQMQVKWLSGKSGYCSAQGEVQLSPLASRHIALHEFGHHLGFQTVEHHPVGGAFLALIGKPEWDKEAREMWAETVAGVLTGRMHGRRREVLAPLLRED